MLDKFKLLLLLCTIILVCFSKSAYCKEIVIGETAIQIPAPKGCIDISSVSQEQFEFFKTLAPETNRLLAIFFPEQEVGRLLSNDYFYYEEHFKVQILKEAEALTISKAQFARISKIYQKDIESLMQNYQTLLDKETGKAGKIFSQKLDAKIDFDINNVIYLGVDEESASHFTATCLTKTNRSIAGESTEYITVVTMTNLLIKGKIIYLYVFRYYNGDEDIELARSKTKAWLSSIRSANNKKCELTDSRLVPKNASIDSRTQKLISEEKAVFSLQGHPKAMDLNISLKYPSS